MRPTLETTHRRTWWSSYDDAMIVDRAREGRLVVAGGFVCVVRCVVRCRVVRCRVVRAREGWRVVVRDCVVRDRVVRTREGQRAVVRVDRFVRGPHVVVDARERC
jgi:hypothetical protein